MARAIALLLGLTCAASYAQTPAQVIDELATVQREARAAQQRIDNVHAQQQRYIEERQLIEADGTRYALVNRELEQRISELGSHLRDLEDDFAAVSETQTGIVTLLVSMTDALAQFVELDLPFQLQRRREAIAALRAALTQSRLSIAEKYQAVVSAYLDEIRLGSSNEFYTAEIETAAGSRRVHVLRLGRAGLWYVTPDGTRAGRWHRGERRWTADGLTRPNEVRRAIAMLDRSGPAAAVTLPVDHAAQ